MSSSSNPRIGLIGLGIMGRPIGHCLLRGGFPVLVFNRSAEKASRIVEAGAMLAASVAEVGKLSDIIFLCLPDSPDVESVLFGAAGIASSARRGTTIIDCSTIAPRESEEFARRLEAAGISMLDCPVSGGSRAAESGALSCFVGGPPEAYQRCLPVLNTIAKVVIHVGSAGSGQIVKACNQLVIAATMIGISEAVAICKNCDIDPEVMREALAGGAANSFVLQNHTKRLITTALQPGFRSSLMRKDLAHAADFARSKGVFAPVADLATQLYSAACARGLGDFDSAAVGLLVQQLSAMTPGLRD